MNIKKDDNPLNIRQWEIANGIGILHSDFDSSLKRLESLTLNTTP